MRGLSLRIWTRTVDDIERVARAEGMAIRPWIRQTLRIEAAVLGCWPTEHVPTERRCKPPVRRELGKVQIGRELVTTPVTEDDAVAFRKCASLACVRGSMSTPSVNAWATAVLLKAIRAHDEVAVTSTALEEETERGGQ